jgi:hypothetical protein
LGDVNLFQARASAGKTRPAKDPKRRSVSCGPSAAAQPKKLTRAQRKPVGASSRPPRRSRTRGSQHSRSLSPATRRTASFAPCDYPSSPQLPTPTPTPRGPALARSPVTRSVRFVPASYHTNLEPKTISVASPTPAAAHPRSPPRRWAAAETEYPSSPPPPNPRSTRPAGCHQLSQGSSTLAHTCSSRSADTTALARSATRTPELHPRVVDAALAAAVPHTPGAMAVAGRVHAQLERVENKIHQKLRALRLGPPLSLAQQARRLPPPPLSPKYSGLSAHCADEAATRPEFRFTKATAETKLWECESSFVHLLLSA